MSNLAELNPFEQFFDLDGRPLDAGYIYVGEPNKDPIDYPVALFWDEAQTIPAAQPLRTVSGYIARSGAPARLYVSGNYSVLVQDKNAVQVYYEADVLLVGSAAVVTYTGFGGVLALNTVCATYAAARALTSSGFAGKFLMVQGRAASYDGGQGVFIYDASDTTTADNGCTVLVDASGRRWKRFYMGPGLLQWVADATGTADATSAIQAMLNVFPDVEGTGNFLCGGLTIPASLRSLNINGTLLANANNATVVQFATDVTRQRIKRIGRLSVENNGKTGVTGIVFGSTTNNPAPGAKESVLYVQADSIYVKGCETGMRHDVTMEHDFRQTVLIQNTVGLKLYADSINGGGNANSFGSLRLQGNTVGAIVRNTSPYPMHNNQFGSLILQENTICGIAFVNCVGQNITSVHIEGNGSGAASITVDGYAIYKSDMLLDNAEVTVVGADLASSLNPCIAATNNSKFIACGFTGYGSSNGNKVSCDATSLYYEDGPVAGIGVTNNHASYGVLTSVQGLALATGTPLTVLSTGQNLYNSNPLYPDVSNVVGVAASGSVVSDYGPTPEVTFASSVGSTATNRLYMPLMTCVASTVNISSFLIKSDKTSTVTIHCFAGAQQLSKTITLSTRWARIVFVSSNAANHQAYIYPADAAGPAIQVQAVQCTSDTLATASEIYQTGKVCLPPLLHGSVTYDPPTLTDGSGVTTNVTVTGAALGDFVTDISFSQDLNGITLSGWVSGVNLVAVRFQNESGGSLDLASGTLRVRVEKKRV